VYREECGTGILPDHLCEFLATVAEAIDYLNAPQHRVDGRLVAVRHCDVKPTNLLLIGNTVKLSDFGVSVFTTSSWQAHPGGGTAAYASPEALRGLVSDRSDQYALAVSYFQLRTGRLPFPEIPPDAGPGYVRPAPDLSLLSEREKPIVARALAPASVDRWPSCVEFIDTLARAVSG
jgi:serine/threonine protein kinase